MLLGQQHQEQRTVGPLRLGDSHDVCVMGTHDEPSGTHDEPSGAHDESRSTLGSRGVLEQVFEPPPWSLLVMQWSILVEQL